MQKHRGNKSSMIQQQLEVIQIPKIMTKYIKDAYKTISNIE